MDSIEPEESTNNLNDINFVCPTCKESKASLNRLQGTFRKAKTRNAQMKLEVRALRRQNRRLQQDIRVCTELEDECSKEDAQSESESELEELGHSSEDEGSYCDNEDPEDPDWDVLENEAAENESSAWNDEDQNPSSRNNIR
ncbi:uncharacterized protein LOC116308671 [Actinia tenebrosa]|uniref:Uncharacterized protein LOC116308671 n=1 Tax=Actinia tenebrosa TaxID=6105 RepID=A0A6P8J4N3_ACTTE|nr:uncharacterized protein LOC116308671 [Actinia tenebrosa]